MSRTRPAPGATVRGETLTVERLAAGGDGVGRLAGKVVFVPQTAPGDVVEIERVEERRTFCRGRVRRVLAPSSHRVAPPCPAFGSCGGCTWQHLEYPEQLAAKRAIVADALQRIGHLAPPEVGETLPSPLAYGYRHRARLHARHRGAAVAFGFFAAGSNTLVPLEGCPVLHRSLEAVLGALARAAARHPGGFARCEEARIDADWPGATVRLILRGAGPTALALPAEAAGMLREDLARAGVTLRCGDDAEAPLALGPGVDALVTTGEAFTQVNLAQNERLVALALDMAAPQPGEESLDLFCGLGNLSVPLAAAGARVLGVDLDAAAIDQARANSRRLGRAATFTRDDAAAAVRDLAAAGRRFPLVVANPPRAGARDTVGGIAALGPRRVLVVSCDPATLARDAAVLLAGGYRAAIVRPVDLFPQTAHVETLALFERERQAPGDSAASTAARRDAS